jgi:hypothetical protein
VPIDWNDNSKRKTLRLALQRVYINKAALALFVDEELNENLEVIAPSSNLQDTAAGLVVWARANGRLNEVYKAFCCENPNDSLITELQQNPLIPSVSKLAEEDWTDLFSLFSPYDFADLQRALLGGYKQIIGAEFREARADQPLPKEVSQIQKLLSELDNPKLAVRFVELAMAQFQRAGEGGSRDLAPLEQWRDRIAEKHKVKLKAPEPIAPIARQGYLLVSLRESGRQTQKDGAFVTVFSELHVVGEAAPIEFKASSVTCPLHEVPGLLSELIQNAEAALIPYECGQVTLELFLPGVHLEEDVADWEVKNEQNRPRPLGLHRRFLVRSLERVMNKTAQAVLKQNWQLLESHAAAKTVCNQFHRQDDCPSPGALSALLDRKPGLSLLAELPANREQRIDILYDIINSAVPIALWLFEFGQYTAKELEQQIHGLLNESQVTNFADLAEKWRNRRAKPENKAIKSLRLLCDCPDRYPSLPDLKNDEDLLVAS